MSVSLLTRTIDGGQEAVFRVRDVLWAITQAAAAAALAWYIAHNLLGHPDPFFAPIAAAGAISASNVLHVQRAIQNISGVALGIIVGAVAKILLGTESTAIALAVFVSLCVAVLIGRGFLGKGLGFGNQAAGSAVLVAALSGGDELGQRLQEALIGSGVALAFTVLLFPANPLTVLRDARVAVLSTLHDILAQTSGKPGTPHAAADRVHERLNDLMDARSNARQLVRAAPRRWSARNAVRSSDEQAARVVLLAGSVLHLVHVVTTHSGGLAEPVQAAIADLTAALNLAEEDPAAAAAHATAAGGCCSSALDLSSFSTTELELTTVAQTCVVDLQEVIDLRQ
jgi:uncharacterized membrane protein YgaE (UPF0421/DUF939 family)